MNELIFPLLLFVLVYFCVIKRRIDVDVRHGKEAIAIQQRTNSLSRDKQQAPDVINGPSTRRDANQTTCCCCFFMFFFFFGIN